MKRILAPLALTLLVAGCQSQGSNGVLGSVEGAKAQAAYTPETKNGYKGVTGENPHAKTRLKNTRSALTGYCPNVTVREGTGIYRLFPRNADGNADGDASIRYQATISKTARECAYEGEDLKMRVGIRGRLINGPSGETGSFAMPIRVAVVEGGRTIYSKLHKPKGAIAKGTSNALFNYVDEEVVIPAPRKKNVRVYVGFDEGPKR